MSLRTRRRPGTGFDAEAYRGGAAPCARWPDSRHVGPVSRWFWLILMWLRWTAPAAASSTDAFTFAVLGDNRGDSGGGLSPAFEEVLVDVRKAAPSFVLNTGDMIYGHTNLATARQEWRSYYQAVSTLDVPVYHVPGNHDIWDASSAALFREVCGPTHFTFDYGSVRFIGLDTESFGSRLGVEQFEWLKQQLALSGERAVFVMLHRPLFPSGAGIGSSLDAFPVERDQLHWLFVQYHRNLKAVFLGHEHGYHMEERDGVLYYTTAGGGANLYEPPELGGFHHFLLVHVSPGKVRVELRKVGPPAAPLRKPVRILPGALLESWEDGRFCYAWDYTVSTEASLQRASQGSRALQFNCDFVQCPWPVLVMPLHPAWDLRGIEALSIDVYVPRHLGGDVCLTPALEGTQKFSASPVRLRAGWNTVRTELDAAWLPEAQRGSIGAVEWGLERRAAVNPERQRGSFVFDKVIAESRSPDGTIARRLVEGWERRLLWRVSDESVVGEVQERLASQGRHGLKLAFDFSSCRRPVLLARLNPRWDLRKVGALVVDVFAPEDVAGGVSIGLALRASEVSHLAPPEQLRKGWNKVRVELNGHWVPGDVLGAAEQLEWRLYADRGSPRGWVVLDNLRTEGH